MGKVAEEWIGKFSYLGLVAAVLFGVGSFVVMRIKAKKAQAKADRELSRAARGPERRRRVTLRVRGPRPRTPSYG
ncbi:hypothetical protein GCM10020000_09640 [Streptomyces olivoverticillatus]